MNNKKVTKLNTSFTNTLESIRSYKRKKTVRRRAIVMVLVGLFLLVLTTIPILKNTQAANEYDEKAVELTEKLESAEREKKALEYEVALLEDDEYIGKLARKELNLSKPNEILINLPEEDESEVEKKDEKSEGKQD